MSPDITSVSLGDGGVTIDRTALFRVLADISLYLLHVCPFSLLFFVPVCLLDPSFLPWRSQSVVAVSITLHNFPQNPWQKQLEGGWFLAFSFSTQHIVDSGCSWPHCINQNTDHDELQVSTCWATLSLFEILELDFFYSLLFCWRFIDGQILPFHALWIEGLKVILF